MKLVLSFSAVITLVCLLHEPPAAFAQFNRRPVRQNCVTPENYYGSCVQLTYCPQVTNVFQQTDRQTAQRYVIALQRSCGTRNIDGDPLVCCTRPISNQVTVRPPSNPFLPTDQTSFVGPRPPPTQPSRNPFFTNPQPVFTTPTPTTTLAPRPAPVLEPKGTSCRGPDTKTGFCTDIKNCNPLLNELRVKQSDATFARFLQASNKICGGSGSIVCCPDGQTPIKPATVRPPPNTEEIPRRFLTVEEGCGYTLNSYKKIVGGEVSRKGAWPWIALIGYEDASTTPFKCGGTLVTARHVVTAAHCIRDDLTFVRLGEHDLSTDSETVVQDIPVSRYEAHPEYNRRNGRSDIAILYLQRNAQFTDKIIPICMPNTPNLRQKSYVGYMPFVAGWGKTMEGGESAQVLNELQIPIFNNEVCRDSYAKKNRYFSTDQFDQAVVCAGVLTGGKDTCQGDSGGPLMVPEDASNGVRFYLIGVVSYGIGCARPDVPGVYSSTQYFMDWLTEKVQNTP